MRHHHHHHISIALGIALTLAVSMANAEEPATDAVPSENRIDGKTVEFDGQTLELAWEGGEPGSAIREFIPAGETLDNWTHLASIREYAAIDDPRALAAETLESVKKNYPGAPHNMAENPDTGETVIDFLVGPPDGSFVEYNIFKYAKRPAGGVIAQQYAVRAYGNTDEFVKDVLPAIQGRVIDEMTTTGLKPSE